MESGADALERLNLSLQERLHNQNQDRMKEIEAEQIRIREEQRSQRDILMRIEANTKSLPELQERVETLEKTESGRKGALAALTAVWGMIDVAAHYFFKK